MRVKFGIHGLGHVFVHISRTSQHLKHRFYTSKSILSRTDKATLKSQNNVLANFYLKQTKTERQKWKLKICVTAYQRSAAVNSEIWTDACGVGIALIYPSRYLARHTANTLDEPGTIDSTHEPTKKQHQTFTNTRKQSRNYANSKQSE